MFVACFAIISIHEAKLLQPITFHQLNVIVMSCIMRHCVVYCHGELPYATPTCSIYFIS